VIDLRIFIFYNEKKRGGMIIIRVKRGWIIGLSVQIVSLSAISAANAIMPLVLPLSDPIMFQRIISWLIIQIAGTLSAYYAVRTGLSNFFAWIMPPVLYTSIPWLIIGYPPGAGPMLLCALVSIMGAAAGVEINKREEKRRQEK
jgi:hypothetical protein